MRLAHNQKIVGSNPTLGSKIMKDPKFGYHWIWMLPTYYMLTTYDYFANAITNAIRAKARRKYPEIQKLAKKIK